MGLVRCCKSFLPIFKKQAIEKTHTDARILNVISMAGIIAGPGMTPYFASKHAALAFTTGLRMELKAFGIQVSAVNPAFHETPLVNSIGDTLTSVWEGLPEEKRKEYGEGTYVYCVWDKNLAHSSRNLSCSCS
jgi:short-subunit dehydrogenase